MDTQKNAIIIKSGDAVAQCLKKSQNLKISCVDGKQLSDMTFIGYNQGLTLDNLRRFILSEGDLLYNSSEIPVLKVKTIYSNANTNIIFPGCRKRVYKNKEGCRDILSKVLGLHPTQLPSTINLFMDFEISAETYEFDIKPSKVRSGDYIVFEVIEDCVVAISACPDIRLGEGKIKIEVF